ncbi:uncharacterized protein CANTADRAFT_3538 [Suhomyces tanzawaensis NRRL Y-17324]|uniref:Uncharacterized protein n=1 Tax=Suhomyces tanzawaensis NRRL Y-17324 TaxID=984487 RepID=A0A1E4SPT2_9ASCO|nr:uncharacterized protein CANTADRAFT_3538 [Suhomyces tanzawaensis NRRL Y-17324]ODV81427.1 hypothetical protein CANTADRAFT_3538 [Suhomyces tanzawaensis NRRL Y-17324]
MSINPNLKYTTVSYKPAGGPSPLARDPTTANLQQPGDTFDTTSSILSDYDDLVGADAEDDDQSLYVLFKPTRSPVAPAANNVSDILSLTNTTATNAYDEDDEESEEEEAVATAAVSPPSTNLSNKINRWYNTSVALAEMVDDNIASWNLDENLMEHSGATVLGDQTSPTNLVGQFYGDDLFAYFDQADLDKFRKFHRLVDIKNYLLARDHQPSGSPSLVRHLLLKVLMSANPPAPEPQARQVPEYLDYLDYRPQDDNTFVPPSTFSDTTSSSLVMCGGAGFGGSASWNDI